MFCWPAAIAAALLIVFAQISSAVAQQLPAVSGPNGKIEFDAGVLTLPFGTTFMARAAGSLTLPVGDRFGIQADINAATAPGFNTSAALHVFTRDPASYLIGGTLGMVRTPGALVLTGGPEAELYMDHWTLEAWGGVAVVYPTAPAPTRVGPFVMADLAYYLNDDWRLSVGLSSLDNFAAVHVGTEYMFDNSPLSVIADTRLGQDGSILATIGLRAYIGAPSKSLIRRHREDDPADRGTQLYNAVGGSTLGVATPLPIPTDEPSSSAPPPSSESSSASEELPPPDTSSSTPPDPSSSSTASEEPLLPVDASSSSPPDPDPSSSASEELPPSSSVAPDPESSVSSSASEEPTPPEPDSSSAAPDPSSSSSAPASEESSSSFEPDPVSSSSSASSEEPVLPSSESSSVDPDPSSSSLASSSEEPVSSSSVEDTSSSASEEPSLPPDPSSSVDPESSVSSSAASEESSSSEPETCPADAVGTYPDCDVPEGGDEASSSEESSSEPGEPVHVCGISRFWNEDTQQCEDF